MLIHAHVSMSVYVSLNVLFPMHMVASEAKRRSVKIVDSK